MGKGWPRLTISCYVVTRKLLEVGGLKAFMVPIDCAHDSWPGLLEHLRSGNGTVVHQLYCLTLSLETLSHSQTGQSQFCPT